MVLFAGVRKRSQVWNKGLHLAIAASLLALPGAAAGAAPPAQEGAQPAPSVISFPTLGAAGNLPGTIDVMRAAEPAAGSPRAGKHAGAATRPVKPTPVKDALLLHRAEAIEARLLTASGLKKEVHVRLDPANMLNAWTGGDNITVTAGLLRFAGSDDELAGVLAHETGHIQAHHPQKVMAATIAAELGNLLVEALGGQDAAIGTAVGSTLALKKYSRDEESEADRIGLGLMENAGYNGAAMPRFFDRLHQLEGEDPAMLGTFLDDHPSDSQRIRRLGTYPQLDPSKPDNQVKLARGLLERDQPYQAAVLALRLSAEYPGDPAIQRLKDDALTAALASASTGASGVPAAPSAGPLSTPPDLRVVPAAAFEGDSAQPAPALSSERDQVRRSSTGLYQVIYTLQGLSQQALGRRTDEVGQYVWYRTFESGWREALDLSEDIDPTAAAVWMTDNVTRMEAAAAAYPATATSAAEAEELTRLQQQRAAAARELESAVSDTADAARSCDQDSRDLERGISDLQLSLQRRNDSASALQSPQLALTWNRSGAGGLARVDAHSALQKAAAAALRLEIDALDWQTRSLQPDRRLSLYAVARQSLGLTDPQGATMPPGVGLGAALFQNLARVTAPAAAPGKSATPAKEAAGGASGPRSLGLVSAAPSGSLLPVQTEAPMLLEINGTGQPLQDPVSQAAAQGQDLDLLHTIFHPVFVNLEREMAASVQFSAAVDSRVASLPSAGN